MASPIVRLATGKLHINAAGISNIPEFTIPAQVNMLGSLYSGTIKATAKIFLQKEKPSFDVNFETEHIELNKLNNFFKAYGNFTVNTGELSLYTEVASADGKYKGYVKPVVKNIDILSNEDEKGNIWHTLWEGVLGTAAKMFQNPQEQQIATKIHIEGAFKETNIDVWYAIMQTLRNAFISVLTPSIDYKTNLGSVKRKGNTK